MLTTTPSSISPSLASPASFLDPGCTTPRCLPSASSHHDPNYSTLASIPCTATPSAPSASPALAVQRKQRIPANAFDPICHPTVRSRRAAVPGCQECYHFPGAQSRESRFVSLAALCLIHGSEIGSDQRRSDLLRQGNIPARWP